MISTCRRSAEYLVATEQIGLEHPWRMCMTHALDAVMSLATRRFHATQCPACRQWLRLDAGDRFVPHKFTEHGGTGPFCLGTELTPEEASAAVVAKLRQECAHE